MVLASSADRGIVSLRVVGALHGSFLFASHSFVSPSSDSEPCTVFCFAWYWRAVPTEGLSLCGLLGPFMGLFCSQVILLFPLRLIRSLVPSFVLHGIGEQCRQRDCLSAGCWGPSWVFFVRKSFFCFPFV